MFTTVSPYNGNRDAPTPLQLSPKVSLRGDLRSAIYSHYLVSAMQRAVLFKAPQQSFQTMNIRQSSTAVRMALVGATLLFAFSFATRLILLIQSHKVVNWDVSLLGSFCCGALFDIVTSMFAGALWLLLGILLPKKITASRPGRIFYQGMLFLYTMALLWIATSEHFFWEEFGVRFNFIAVDYLIFTQEVFDNIFESYPMGLIISLMMATSFALVWLLTRKRVVAWVLAGGNRGLFTTVTTAITACVIAITVLFVKQSSLPNFANQYHAELAKNGCWSFFAAYQKMELDYEKWYLALPGDEAQQHLKSQFATSARTGTFSGVSNDLNRHILGTTPEKQWNVITICMESMSASFMGSREKGKNLTPCLDQLASESLYFSNLYATGTRTVRGMEALTLSLPPTPGQSILYRPEGINLQTSFSPFLDRNYDCAFIYGGHGQFDYMNRYFSTSGCRILDIAAWKKEDTTFSTAWGSCDGDLFRKAISEADADHAAGKPFHFFCMTTSNHRPYDFPDGCIEKKSHSGRNAAVQYSDWAVGQLIKEAKTKPWFQNTIFVFCSDHCASSAGKSDIEIKKYEIPAMIYNPGLVPAQDCKRLCSQIDVMPTVFGLMGWNYDTKALGTDQLDPALEGKAGRAFVSNYQKIAMLKEGQVAVLKPNRITSCYNYAAKTGELTPLADRECQSLIKDTVSYYQSASWLFQSGSLKRKQQ